MVRQLAGSPTLPGSPAYDVIGAYVIGAACTYCDPKQLTTSAAIRVFFM